MDTTPLPPTSTPTTDPTTEVPPPTEDAFRYPDSRPLLRPRDGRLVGGVCASLAEYFGIDVLLVRVVAVVLAVSGGAGLAAYLALWLLTPSSGNPGSAPPVRPLFAGGSRPRRTLQAIGVLVLAVVVTSVITHAALVLVPVLVIVAAVAALVTGRRWWRALAALLLLVLVGLGVVAATGRHLGSREFAVARAGDIAPAYGSPTGTVQLDLRGLVLDRDRSTAVWVGSGNVEVEVPAGLAVHVEGRTGAGSVSVFGRTASGPGATVSADAGPTSPATPRLDIDATAGAGRVVVTSVG
jgi:phage shock protein PspC (stress-responsive transcriptional regulator)